LINTQVYLLLTVEL